MTTQTRNEAAERLLAEYIGGAPEAVALLNEALRVEGERRFHRHLTVRKAERRATVERIKTRVLDLWLNDMDEIELQRVLAILDEEAQP